MSEEKKERPGFLLYKDDAYLLKKLDDHQAATLFRAIFAYQLGEDLPDMDAAVDVTFSVLQQKFDRDAKAYDDKRDRLRDNGKKGGRPRKKREEDPEESAPEDEPETNCFSEKPKETKWFSEKPKETKQNHNRNSNCNSNLKDVYTSNHIISIQTRMDGMGSDARQIANDQYMKVIQGNINHDMLTDMYADNDIKLQLLDALETTMWEVMIGDREAYRIEGTTFPADTVKSQMMKLTWGHIDYVISSVMNVTSGQIKRKGYLISALFNAPKTMTANYISGIKSTAIGGE